MPPPMRGRSSARFAAAASTPRSTRIARNGVLDFHAETAAWPAHPDGRSSGVRHRGELVARALVPESARGRAPSQRSCASRRRRGSRVSAVSDAEGAYRVEVRVPGAPGDAASAVDRRQSNLLLARRRARRRGARRRGSYRARCRPPTGELKRTRRRAPSSARAVGRSSSRMRCPRGTGKVSIAAVAADVPPGAARASSSRCPPTGQRRLSVQLRDAPATDGDDRYTSIPTRLATSTIPLELFAQSAR